MTPITQGIGYPVVAERGTLPALSLVSAQRNARNGPNARLLRTFLTQLT